MNSDIKLLITSGCSFSQVPNKAVTWPAHLANFLACDVQYHGRGACGNGIISKTIVYNVNEALKTYKPTELLVGIAWSGSNRHEYYSDNMRLQYQQLSTLPMYCNPQWIIDPDDRNYYILHPQWNDDLSRMFFHTFYDEIDGKIKTIEHILRIQWFLKLHGIKYFMTEYAPDCLPRGKLKDNTDIAALYSMIDFDNFLNIKDILTWSQFDSNQHREIIDGHPDTEHHRTLVNTVIIPHLKLKNYIKFE